MNIIPSSNPPSSGREPFSATSARPPLSTSLSHLSRKSVQVSFDGRCGLSYSTCTALSMISPFLQLCAFCLLRAKIAPPIFIFRIVGLQFLMHSTPSKWTSSGLTNRTCTETLDRVQYLHCEQTARPTYHRRHHGLKPGLSTTCRQKDRSSQSIGIYPVF